MQPNEESACLEPADRLAQQERILENPAGQRHRAQAVPVTHGQATRFDQRGNAVVETSRDDRGGDLGR